MIKVVKLSNQSKANNDDNNLLNFVWMIYYNYGLKITLRSTVLLLLLKINGITGKSLDQPLRTVHKLVGVLFRESGGWALSVCVWLTGGVGSGDAPGECMPPHTLVDDGRCSSVGVGEVALGSPLATPTTGPPPAAFGGTRCSWTEANLVTDKYLDDNVQYVTIFCIHTCHFS